jgi:hypothetical protein
MPYAFASDSSLIKVHFLYGSKHKKEFKPLEKRWFGGMLGGHVGIEYAPGLVIDFVPSGSFHVISHSGNMHSRFNNRTVTSFWTALGSNTHDAKKASFVIPISEMQKRGLDSLVHVYTQTTPYDYAFVGMRCSAAAYDILSQIDVLDKYDRWEMVFKIFYPKRLRKRLFRLAKEKAWKVEMQAGTYKRVWERD